MSMCKAEAPASLCLVRFRRRIGGNGAAMPATGGAVERIMWISYNEIGR